MSNIRARIVDAAMELFGVERSLKDAREAFRHLKQDHAGEMVCVIDHSEPCEACQQFEALYDYKYLLKRRASAKRKILTACAHLGDRPEPAEAQDGGVVAKE